MYNKAVKELIKIFNKSNWLSFLSARPSKVMSLELNAKPDTELTNEKKRQLEEDDNENSIKIPKVETKRIKLKKHAIILGYLGKNYSGMQRNPGTKTIEEDLINALYKADLINTEAFETIQSASFQRAARTDKGVSARRQVVSIALPKTATVEEINQYLPNEIRVFGVRRTTKGFNSKTQADSRTYTYTVPTYAFAPEPKELILGTDDPDFDQRKTDLSIIDGKPFNEYRLPDSVLEKLNVFLSKFEGTHNFHNFTSKVKPLDPRAKRFMIKCHCKKKFISHGMEFAVLEIHGQSFMLHQIRKMVALTISYVRNIIPEETIQQAFAQDRIDVPIAPSLGLVLHYIHYGYYNKRYGNDGIHEKLNWDESEKEIQAFEDEYILKHIVDTEIRENVTLDWLVTLANHHFGMREEDLPLNEKSEALQ